NVATILGEPVADGSIFPTCLLSSFTRNHVKVALSGDGADELFAGYPTHRLWRTGSLMARIPSPMRAAGIRVMNAMLPVSHDNLSFDFRLRKFVDGLDRDPIRQNQRWLGTFTAEELAALLVEPELAGQAELEKLLHQPSHNASGLERILRTDQRFYMQDQVLVKVDRASMAASLEVRVPFLDDEMVSFARNLQADRKIRGGTSKWLLRRYASRFFPESIWKRPKKGFGVPLGRWFRGELKSLVRDVLSARFLASSGLFRPEAIERLLVEHEQGIRDHRKKIFNLLLFALWYEDARTWGRN
ncbi:MAG: asparagine synthetase B family protein, partial [Thermoanaerobaculia bacterium]